MKKHGLILSILTATSFVFSLCFINKTNSRTNIDSESAQFAPPGMVAYAASYSDSATSEPQYNTQNNKTFQYLNLGDTLSYYRGDSVKVGIIDSGINYDHEDFMVNSSTKVKGDSKYYEYQTSSWVYYKASQHGYSYIDDSLGHGTNVAATVAAAINSVGGTGLAPNVELYVYKVTNSSNGYEFGAIQNALMDAQSLGIKVINMSFQSYEHAVTYNSSTMGASSGCSTTLSYYLNQAYNAGITLVGAAGNYNTDEPSYPGSNNHVINVGSLSSDGTTKAPFSNYGSTIDLVAPGYVHVADKETNSSYKDTSGTSFSAPLVTAAIALYLQQNPSATPSQIESALYASCDPIDDSESQYTNWAGNGALNVARFLNIPEDDSPTDIVINNPEVLNEELELEVGGTFDLDWTVNGVGTFDDSVDIYLLDDNGTLSVDENGRITALSTGSDYVVIESTVASNVYASLYVTVTSSGGGSSVTSVTVSPSLLNLDLNGSTTGNLSATVNGTGSVSQTVTWSSSDTSVATVSALGVVTAKAVGNATITAQSTQDTSVTGTCSVTVSDSTVHVSSVSLNKNATELLVGSTEALTATVLPNNATNKSVTWTSSNTSVATVSNGTITAVATGNATITVTTVDGSKTTTCVVTVTSNEKTLTITRSSFSTSGGYAWYDWSQATSDSSATISGKGELYTTTTSSMQFNKSKGNKVAAIYNSVAIPGSITKIEATSQQTTIRSWTAYVTSTACSGSGTSLTFGSNKTTVGAASPAVGTSTSFGTSSAGYSFFCLQENDSSASYLSEIKITYQPKTLSSIVVKTAPYKTSYEAGDNFDPTGLVITATYSDSTTSDISYADSSALFSFTPSLSDLLTTDNTSVSITYGGKSCNQSIVVTAAKILSSISISNYTTSFVEGDTFSFGGTVTANYSDSTSENVTGTASFTGYEMTTLGNQTVTVSYGGKSQTYQITVSQGSLSSIAVSGQTTTYMKNTVFSFDGTCTATFANGYQKVVTPTSVTSPDMSTAGNKTITVSFTYNGNTRTTTYDITVNSDRTVIEEGYSVIGTVTYTSGSEVISVNTLSTSKSGYTNLENGPDTSHKAIRLGSGSKTGTLTILSTSSNIRKVVVNARTYNTDSPVSLTIGETANSLTTSYADYTKEYTTATNSVAIATTTNGKRAWISSVTVYSYGSQDISQSEDCKGLETFINTYMHMDYTENLGYCNDSEHHYYSTAKTAFNALNEHQRSLFISNSAYATEWIRLSTWASKNGEALNNDNSLAARMIINPINIVNAGNTITIIIVIIVSSLSIAAFVAYFSLKKKKSK